MTKKTPKSTQRLTHATSLTEARLPKRLRLPFILGDPSGDVEIYRAHSVEILDEYKTVDASEVGLLRTDYPLRSDPGAHKVTIIAFSESNGWQRRVSLHELPIRHNQGLRAWLKSIPRAEMISRDIEGGEES